MPRVREVLDPTQVWTGTLRTEARPTLSLWWVLDVVDTWDLTVPSLKRAPWKTELDRDLSRSKATEGRSLTSGV